MVIPTKHMSPNTGYMRLTIVILLVMYTHSLVEEDTAHHIHHMKVVLRNRVNS